MTEKQAQEIMEKTIINGTPHPNTLEYMEALEISIDILGANYTREQLKNWVLCGKYPFLVPRYEWSGEILKDYDYTSTYLDDMPDGWKIAFGEMMCEEIKQELVRCNYLNEYRILQIKEKYGGLRWYDNGTPIGCKVQEIIDKYSVLSENICIICGKPDVPIIGSGWICPYCKKCYTTPSDWYKKEHPDKIDEWIEFHSDDWEEYNKEETNKMVSTYSVHTWSKEKGDEEIIYDISETVQKIRAKWKAEHGNN
mgnify:CR=1 FL=1